MDSTAYRGEGTVWRCPHRHERGQTVVEFALVIPVVLLLLFATLELGMFYKTHSAYQEAAQEAVRIAAAAGSASDGSSNADLQALNQLKAMLPAENLNNIQSVTIYDATAGGAMVTPATQPISTTYTYGNTGWTCANTNSAAPCPSGSSVPGSGWYPGLRNTTAGSLDHIGVSVVYKTSGVTGILPTLTITQTAATVMEPLTYGQ